MGEALRSYEPDAAAWCILAAHREVPQAAAYVSLGSVLQQGGRLGAARDAYRLALQHRPAHGHETALAARSLALLTTHVAALQSTCLVVLEEKLVRVQEELACLSQWKDRRMVTVQEMLKRGEAALAVLLAAVVANREREEAAEALAAWEAAKRALS